MTVTKRWRGMRWTRQCRHVPCVRGRTACSVRRNRVVLTHQGWRQVGDDAYASGWRWWHSSATRESAYKSSSHCAGKAGVFPLNLYARVRIFKSINAHEIAGAARTRSSLRPLQGGGANEIVSLGQNHVAGTQTHISSSPRTRGPIRRAVSFYAMRSMFSFPTNARGDGSPRSRGRH